MSEDLFAIGEDMRRLDALLTDNGGDLSDPAVEAVFDAFLQRTQDLDHKLRGYVAYIAKRQRNSEACAAEIARIAKIKQADDNAVERLHDRLKAFFELHGIERMDLGTTKLGIQKNGGLQKLVVAVKSAWRLPDWAQKRRFVVEQDNDVLRQYVTECGPLVGDDGEVLASLAPRGTQLRIR